MKRTFLTLWAAIGIAFTLTLSAADEVAYRQAVDQGKALLQEGKHSEAFQKLQGAVVADPTHYESYFYLAVVSYRMGNLSAAEEYGKQALARVPPAEKAQVQEMMEVIGERGKFDRHERAGDEAFNNALMAKAAEEYRQAFLLFPTQAHVGLKTAEIYADRLDRPFDAAILWTKILASGDETTASAARAGLNKHAQAIERGYEERLKGGRIDDLLLLAEMFPDRLDPHFAAAVHFASRSNSPETIRHLTAAIKIGIPASRISEQAEFRALLAAASEGSPFERFLNDAFGASLPRVMKEQKRQENEVRRLAEEQRERERQAQMRRLEEQREKERQAQARRVEEERRQREVVEAVAREIGENMVEISPGIFTMGTPGGLFGSKGDSDERPTTQVSFSRAYWLGKYEVTQRQWQAIMENNPSHFKGENLPVESISWDEAMAFCRRLTELEWAARRLPSGYIYTLPTEAQWEYAARAGTTGDYGGTGNLDEMGWYKDYSGSKTHPVGGKQANAWGLHDMHGNVWELCADWYGAYPGGSLTNYAGRSSGASRVFRGGGWGGTAGYCRSANRGSGAPAIRSSSLGFRPALSPAP